MNDVPVKSSKLLQREEKNISRFLISLVIVSVSGFITWIYPSHGIWQQWTYLLHTILGFWLAILSCQYF